MIRVYFRWRRIPVAEQILSARVGPFRSRLESVWRGGNREFSLENSVIIECLTTGGTFEFNVGLTNVDLVLHYLNKLAGSPAVPSRDGD